MQKSETSFLSGPNAAFITELYARYAEDPQSVDADWRDYFSSLGEEAQAALAGEIVPIDDIRSTRDYRLKVSLNLLEDFLLQLGPTAE